MKNKNILILIILILGVGLLSYGLFSYWPSLENDKREDVSNDISSQEDDLKWIPITNYSNNKDINKELCVSNFLVQENKDPIVIKFYLLNNTDKIIKNKILKINFYSKNELIDTYEYEIEEIDVSYEIGIETSINYEKDIDKYEFEYDSFKTEVNLDE